jgi:hypothetical protein
MKTVQEIINQEPIFLNDWIESGAIGVSGIDKITRLGSDTEGWKEVHPETYKSVANYLRTLEQL